MVFQVIEGALGKDLKSSHCVAFAFLEEKVTRDS